jgi:FxLD family lantipeptide
MTKKINATTQAVPADPGTTQADGFDLDVTLVDVGDTAALINLTNDGCGSTCGACTTNVA